MKKMVCIWNIVYIFAVLRDNNYNTNKKEKENENRRFQKRPAA